VDDYDASLARSKYAHSNSDSLKFISGESDPLQIYHTFDANVGRFTIITTHKGLNDSGTFFVPFKDKAVFESITVKGDNDQDFPVVFDQKDKRVGRFALNWNLNDVNTYGTLNVTVVFKQLGVTTPNPYPSGTEFSFCISAIKANGVWYEDSAWSDIYKLASSTPWVELSAPENPVIKDPLTDFTQLCKITFGAKGNFVNVKNLQIGLYHEGVSIDAYSGEIIDWSTGTTIGSVVIKPTAKNRMVANLTFSDTYHPVGIRVEDDHPHVFYLLVRADKKKKDGFIIPSLGLPQKWVWEDSDNPFDPDGIGREYSGANYWKSSEDYHTDLGIKIQ
jgi:hypothetical protein